ncbi:HECT domain and RCC1-like domain protein (macronuclear) [Tetrahymena thermophila SB210]|uniref:HECT domain and RCC1-like domain protein n=1 Tax=Tetrahymena thermophila (strain SB210) TaxID=312017 RepID=Q23K61_TETTS|nr:HECT domain and RCC1-like domain protein [Tetrahymena thermophila SB210]EAR96982.2 HECT domain and RCC1-like domain protein [Tetrahymena thermophila SB210]|eukprot:XP_001017227.2 HECT domain and RCC1-like domain protein [Tetrahymena thermophila SB210]
MSLPNHIQLGDDNFLNLQNYGSDPDFLYFSSLKETIGVCEKSIQHDVKELNLSTPFESLNQTVEFSESALEKLREKSIKQIDQQTNIFTKSLKNQISEYHFRNSIQINQNLKNKSQNSFGLVEDFDSEIQKIKDCALDQWNFNKLKGNNPSKWPFDLSDFIKDIKKQPLLSQFNEPEFFNQEFINKVKQVIKQNLAVLQQSQVEQKNRKSALDLIIDSTIAIFYVNFNRGSFEDLIQILDIIEESKQLLNEAEQDIFIQRFSAVVNPCFDKIEKQIKMGSKLHYMRNLCDQGGFKVSSFQQFYKQSFFTTSMTTDGTYLYIYISSADGGIYKVGTGNNNTIPGKVYASQQVSKQEEICWTYLKGSLYLRTSTKEQSGLIDIYNCDTLEQVDTIQLKNEDIFEGAQQQQLNKNFPLLSDGDYLYIIGKKIVVQNLKDTKAPEAKDLIPVPPPPNLTQINEDKKKEKIKAPEQPQAEEQASQKLVKKIKAKATKSSTSAVTQTQPPEDNEQIRMIEFYLYKYDIESPMIEKKKEKVEEEFIQIDEYQLLGIQEQYQPELNKQPSQVQQQQPQQQPQDLNQEKQQPEQEKNQQQPDQKNEEEQQKQSSIQLLEKESKKIDVNKIQEEQKKDGSKTTIPQTPSSKQDVKKEQKKTKFGIIQKTLLAQSEIAQETQKNIKNTSDIVVKEHSIILPLNVSCSLWTMNKDQITLYSEQGIKIFSKNPKDIHEIDPQAYFKFMNSIKNNENLSEANNQFLNKIFQGDEQSLNSLKESNDFLAKFNHTIRFTSKDKSATMYQEIQKSFQQNIQQMQQLNGQASLQIEGKKLSMKKEESIRKDSGTQPLVATATDKKAQSSSGKRLMKTTLITKLDSNKKIHQNNPSYHVCYDIKNGVYYVLNWLLNPYTNVFPSLITLVFDQNKYIDQKLHSYIDKVDTLNNFSSNIASQSENQTSNSHIFEEFSIHFMKKLLILQRYRLEFPWKLNRWDYTYGYSLSELNSKKSNSTASSSVIAAEEKKLLSRQKTKLLQRLNKQLEYQKPLIQKEREQLKSQQKALREIQKIYAFCINGSVETFNYIYQKIVSFLDSFDKSSNLAQRKAILLLTSLLYWLKHCQLLTIREQQMDEKFSLLIQKFFNLLQDQQVSVDIKQLMITIIQESWSFLTKNHQNQINILNQIKNIQSSIKDTNLSDNLNWIEILYKNQVDVCQSILKDFPLKEYMVEQIKESDVVDEVDQNTNINNIYRRNRYLKVTQKTFCEPIARLLFDDITYCKEILIYHSSFEDLYDQLFVYPEKSPKTLENSQLDAKKKEIEEDEEDIYISQSQIEKHKEYSQTFWKMIEDEAISSCQISDITLQQNFKSGLLLWKLVRYLLEEFQIQLLKIKNGQIEWEQRYKISKRFINLIESALECLAQNIKNIQTAASKDYLRQLIQEINGCLALYLQLSFASSISVYPKSIDIFYTLKKIFAHMKKILMVEKGSVQQNEGTTNSDQNDNLPSELCFAEQIYANHSEGLDQTIEKVFETNHPYERGKVIQFEQNMFPGAIAIAIHFDKRCQSDASNDFLQISGWYDYQKGTQTGYNIQSREGLGKTFKLSGKAVPKRQLILLGNTIQVEFHSSGHAKDEKSLSRWGYKISARPIYGMNKKMWSEEEASEEFKKIIDRFGNEDLLTEWLNTMKLCIISISEAIKNISQNSIVSAKEKNLNNFLKLAILKNGYSSKNREDYLVRFEDFSTNPAQGLWDISNVVATQGFEQALAIFQKFQVPTTHENTHSSLKQDLYFKLYRQLSDDYVERCFKYNFCKEKQEQNQDTEPTIASINWNVQVTNSILSSYIKQIQEKQGEFYNFYQEVSSKLKDPTQYTHEKIRPTFKKEFKELWFQCEALLFLACLYHCGLIQIGLSQSKEYIIDHLQGLQTTRNEIIAKMLNLVQQEKEFQHTIESLYEAKVEFDDEQNKILQEKKAQLEQIEKEEQLKKKQQEEAAQKPAIQSKPTEKIVKQGKKIKFIRQGAPISSSNKPKSSQPQKEVGNQQTNQTSASNTEKNNEKESQKLQNGEKRVPRRVERIEDENEEEKEQIESDEEIQEDIDFNRQLRRTASRKVLNKQMSQKEEEFQFQPELESFLWEKFQKRYGGGNNDALKQLCESRNISYDEDDILTTTKRIYNICKQTLIKLVKSQKDASKKQGESSFQLQILEQRSAYEIIGVQIAQKCLFLLSLNYKQAYAQSTSSQTNQSIDGSVTDMMDDLPDLAGGLSRGDSTFSDLDIKPVGVNRSISQPINEKTIDKDKLRSFRAWVDSYQKWKQYRKQDEIPEIFEQTEEYNELYSIHNYNPLKSIAFFLCSNVKCDDIKTILDHQDYRCSRRIASISLLNSVYSLTSNTCFERYVIGIVNDLLGCDLHQDVTCAGRNLKELYVEELKTSFTKSIEVINKKVEKMMKIRLQDMIIQVQKVKFENKMNIGLNGILQEQLKTINLALADILTMVSGTSDLLWKIRRLTSQGNSQSSSASNNTQNNDQYWAGLNTFFSNLLSVGLISTSFSQMYNKFEDIVLLVNYMNHLVENILNKVIQSAPYRYVEVLIEVIHNHIMKEYGLQKIAGAEENKKENYEINARVFLRIFDPVGQLRLSFLLQTLDYCLSKRYSPMREKQKQAKKNVTSDLPVFYELTQSLLFYAYQSETPVQVRLVLRCLKKLSHLFIINDDQAKNNNILSSPFNPKYFFYEVQNLQEISVHCSKELTQNYMQILQTIPKPVLKKTYLEFNKPSSKIFPLHYINLLFEKIGNYILNEKGEQSEPTLRQSLTKLLTKVQISNQFKNRNSSLYLTFNSEQNKKRDKNASVVEKSDNSSNTYIVLGQLSEEEDLTFLLKVLYYWEELYPTSTSLSLPKTVESYLEQKKILDQKKETLQKTTAASQSQTEKVDADANSSHSQRLHKLMDKIFIALPEINGISEKEEELPVGWQFNYIGLFSDLTVFQSDTKRGKIKKKVKQVWQNLGIATLMKKMDQADKDIKEFEETDTIETKMEIIKAKNFIHRIQAHLKDIQTIASLFNIFGYGPMFDFLPQDKAQELASLVNFGIKNQLKPIPLDGIKEQYKKIIDPNDICLPRAEKKSVVSKDPEPEKQSQMVVQICSGSIFPQYEIGIDIITSLSSKESFFTEANAQSIIQTHCKGGQSTNNIVSDLIEFFRYLCVNDENQFNLQQTNLKLSLESIITKNWESEFSPLDRSVITGILNVVGGWPQSVRQTAKCILNNVDYEQDTECVLSGGIGSGQKKCNIISTCSPTVAVQTVQLRNITPMYEEEWAIDKFDCFSELFQAIQKCATLMNGANIGQPIKQKTPEPKKADEQKDQKADEQKDQKPSEESEKPKSGSEGEKQEQEIPDSKEPAQNQQTAATETSKQESESQIATEEEEKNIQQQYQWRIRVGLLMRFLLQIANKLEWNRAVEKNLLTKEQGLKLLEIIDSMCKQGLSQEKMNSIACEEEFISSWEQYIDKNQSALEWIKFPKMFNRSKKKYTFLKDSSENFPSLKKLTSSQAADETGDLRDFIFSPSPYIEQLPQDQPEISENKLLKYWEKFVIPKIYDFVKSTLKPYELEDFFEQIRYPLRKGDQTRAMNVAYIICEKNLPSGVVLPDANHDWSTISIEDVRVGQWLLASIINKKTNSLLTPFFSREKLLAGGNTNIPVLAIGIDARNSAVLCLYQDHDRSHLISVWIPVTCLKNPEQPIRPPASSYSLNYISESFLQSMIRSITVLSRQVLLQFFSLGTNALTQLPTVDVLVKENNLLNDLRLSFLEIIRSSIIEEIVDDPLFGWIKTNGSILYLQSDLYKQIKQQHSHISFVPKQENDQFAQLRSHIKHDTSAHHDHQAHLYPFKKLRQIQHFIDWAGLENKTTINLLFDFIMQSFKPQITLINRYVQDINIVNLAQSNSPDGQVQNSSNSKPFRLCQFEGPDSEQIGAIILSFRKDAFLGVYSGLKFFEDELGINKISQLNAGKQSKKSIEPMMFKGRDVYCSYYFNKHQLSPLEQDSNQSTLPCVIYGIPKDWNMVCWLIDSVSSSLMKNKDDKESLEKLGKIMTLLTESFDYLKGPCIVKQLLAKLIIRTARKLRFLVRSQIYSGVLIPNSNEQIKQHWQILGVKQEFVKNNITKANEIKSRFSQETNLYSSFTQDYIEMLQTLTVPIIHLKEDLFTINPKQLLSENQDSQSLPKWLEVGANLQILMNFFEDQGLLSNEIYNKFQNIQMEFENLQQEGIIMIKNLPSEWTIEETRSHILFVLEKSKLRVLNPSSDIFVLSEDQYKHLQSKQKQSDELEVPQSQQQTQNKSQKLCIVLTDGSAVLDLEEVAQEKKREQEEKEKLEAQQNGTDKEAEGNQAQQPQAPAHPEFWSCDTCTLQNAWESQICDACESPKPENIPLENDDKGGDEKKENENQQDQEANEIPLDEILENERKEEIEKVNKFLENMKSFVNDYYKTKKQTLSNQITELINQKKELEETFNKEKEQLEQEIKKKSLKDQKKQEKLKLLEESKKRKEDKRKSSSKKQSKDSSVSNTTIASNSAANSNLQDQITLQQLEEQLKNEETKYTSKTQEIDQKKQQFDSEIQEIEQLQDSCLTFQGQNSVILNSYTQLLERFLCLRFLDESQVKVKQCVLNKFDQRCQNLSSKFLEELASQMNISEYRNHKNIQNKFVSLILDGKALEAIKILSKLGLDIHLDYVAHTKADQKLVLPAQLLSQLVQFVEIEVCKETKMVLKYNSTNIRFHLSSYNISEHENPIGYSSESSVLPYKKLTEQPLADLRFSWALLKLINKFLQKNVSLLNMSSKEEPLDSHTQSQKYKNGGKLDLSVSDQLSENRSFWLSPIKIDLSQKVLNMTSIKRDSVPKVQVERLKLQRASDAAAQAASSQGQNQMNDIFSHHSTKTQNFKNIVSSHHKEDFLFTKAFDQIKDFSVTLLRPVKPTGTDPFIAFETIFKGELVMGESGPYRQFFADISSELQPNVLSAHQRQLNLLLPSTNNLSKLGDARDKYVVNPSAKSSYQLQLFEFLGVLMGTCVRTGTHLTLDLPQILWKQLVGEEITLEDLEEVDRPVFDMIKFIDSCEKTVFQESFFETYTTTLSDLSTVELKKNGSKINVTYEDRQDYIARVVEAKIRESSLQIQAIKNGLTQIIPQSLLNTVRSADLEMWVCGRKKVDFDLLKRHTIYSPSINENTPHIKYLWEVLHELSHTESLRFVKFCWGQERLPANDEEFERNQIRFMIKPATYQTYQPDKALPKADTCFFNLELPAYTTKQALKTQLLIAINTDCDSMNAEDPIALDPEPNYGGDPGNYSSDEECE